MTVKSVQWQRHACSANPPVLNEWRYLYLTQTICTLKMNKGICIHTINAPTCWSELRHPYLASECISAYEVKKWAPASTYTGNTPAESGWWRPDESDCWWRSSWWQPLICSSGPASAALPSDWHSSLELSAYSTSCLTGTLHQNCLHTAHHVWHSSLQVPVPAYSTSCLTLFPTSACIKHIMFDTSL